MMTSSRSYKFMMNRPAHSRLLLVRNDGMWRILNTTSEILENRPSNTIYTTNSACNIHMNLGKK